MSEMTVDRWLTLISIVVSSLISWLFARHYYRRSEKRRAPTFVLHSSRKVLATPELAGVPGASILFDGAEVGKHGITEAQVYFWNSGGIPILRDEVLEPFCASLPGSILRCSVLKVSRDVVGLQVAVRDKQSAVLQFSLLEPGDGGTVAIIYDGPPSAKIEFSGSCVGSPRPLVLGFDSVYLTPMSERRKEAYFLALTLPGLLLVIAAAAGLTVGLINGLGWLVRRFLGESAAKPWATWLQLCFLGGFLFH
jgi:hypothetical protein